MKCGLKSECLRFVQLFEMGKIFADLRKDPDVQTLSEEIFED